MDIWIIINGESSGPMPEFSVRAKIAAGEFDADTPAWHEGLSGWTPLRELALFRREFDPLPKPELEGAGHSRADDAEPRSLPDQHPANGGLQTKAYAVRRFWARWFDLYVYVGLWWFAMWAIGNDIRALLGNLPVMLMIYLPWFGLEVLMIHYFGTTPGKWLLGLRVRNRDGALLTLSESLRRTLRVCFLGTGMGWEMVSLVCQSIAYVQAKRTGTTLWDAVGQHEVLCNPLRPVRVIVYAIVLFGALQLQAAVLAPYLRAALVESFPALRQTLEETPHWQLPPRHAPVTR